MKKKLICAAAALCISAAFVCAEGVKQAGGKVKIGVSMPARSLQRWNQDGANIKSQLEAIGYQVLLRYAGNNDIPAQIEQIETMILGDVKVLVIAAIDGPALTGVLRQAKEKNIPVIAYDRLIMGSDAVSYYVSFDNFKVGVLQGSYIESKLDLKRAEGPFNIELVTGAPDDNNAEFLFDGAMSVLKPYIDSGKLKVPSGQTAQAQSATPEWSMEAAQKRIENIITFVNYGPGGVRLDAVLCSNDSTANGVTNALVNAGYTKDNFPILTGQDCDKSSVKNMIAGIQSMSVFKDTRTLASKVVEMVNILAKGGKPPVNDTKTYNNGARVIPSFLCDPIVVEPKDIGLALIDSGYYKPSDIQ